MHQSSMVTNILLHQSLMAASFCRFKDYAVSFHKFIDIAVFFCPGYTRTSNGALTTTMSGFKFSSDFFCASISSFVSRPMQETVNRKWCA